METYIILAYQFAAVLLPCVVVYALLRGRGKHESGAAAGRLPLVLLLAAYFCAVFYLTGSGTLYDLLRHGLELERANINWLPFSHDISLVGYVLNVVLFLPLGFLLPVIWPCMRSLGRVALSGLSVSLLIELSQLLNPRSSDVDDLLMNTLGAVLGYLAFRVLAGLLRRDVKRTPAGKGAPALYIAALFLGNFLLYNEMGIAGLLYGF